jgi:hypothetical protein
MLNDEIKKINCTKSSKIKITIKKKSNSKKIEDE